MAQWTRGMRAQGNVALILVITAIIALFIVNFAIRKMIDSDDTPASQVQNNAGSVIEKQDLDMPAAVAPSSGQDLSSPAAAAVAAKPQMAPSEVEKEIIHEPSIKENILLQ